MLAVRALGRLAGLLQGKLASAPCQAARTALSALLTPALAAQLANPDPKPLLVHLNSSLLNPQARPAAQTLYLDTSWLPNTHDDANSYPAALRASPAERRCQKPPSVLTSNVQLRTRTGINVR